MRVKGRAFFAILFSVSQYLWGAQAQTSSASFQFPNQDGLTVNYIDTTVIRWTSNYAEAFLLMWCQNGTVGNNVVLGSRSYLRKIEIKRAEAFPGSSFQVLPIGTYGYILSVEDPSQSVFPVACHAELLPTPGGSGVDTPFGITFSSSPGLKAQTFSLSSSSSSTSQAVMTTSTSATSGTTKDTSTITTSKPSDAKNTSPTGPSTTSSPAGSSSGSVPVASIPSNAATTGTNANNTGAIVGGVIGGLALLCFVVFGVLILRKVQRKDDDSKPKRTHSWWRFHQNTEMQTGGLHEKDGGEILKFEKDGNPRFEKEGSTPLRHEREGSMPKRATAVELPAEAIIRDEEA
ncbi:uncharacterized protein PAC_09951 [Phialocephala subalpina]|uniref:Mid2 domain-containing protein n=1 Tax=Phialocephala subalpina TaxID=576137 RepID=A0A1L7X4V7_9HELO|nr:uncharacterized protein PAC_09951 [Phialocephala subalpina]